MDCCICYESINRETDIDHDNYSEFSNITTPCEHACCRACWIMFYKKLKEKQIARCPVCRLTIDRWLTRFYKPDSSIQDSDIYCEDGGEIGDIVYLYNPETKERAIQLLSHEEKPQFPWIETHRELCD